MSLILDAKGHRRRLRQQRVPTRAWFMAHGQHLKPCFEHAVGIRRWCHVEALAAMSSPMQTHIYPPVKPRVALTPPQARPWHLWATIQVGLYQVIRFDRWNWWWWGQLVPAIPKQWSPGACTRSLQVCWDRKQLMLKGDRSYRATSPSEPQHTWLCMLWMLRCKRADGWHWLRILPVVGFYKHLLSYHLILNQILSNRTFRHRVTAQIADFCSCPYTCRLYLL